VTLHPNEYYNHLSHRKHDQNIAASKLDNTTLAKRIKDEIQILCWVMAVTDIELDAAIYIRDSWGHRCNKFIIISSHSLKSVGAISVLDDTANIREWNATRHSLWYLFENELDYDWFYNADYYT
jgi:glycoprotein-N-acetylgalactosamine 3-beta-galactosyltransferase